MLKVSNHGYIEFSRESWEWKIVFHKNDKVFSVLRKKVIFVQKKVRENFGVIRGV